MTSLGSVGQRITEKLNSTFNPAEIRVIDESAKHIGHSGARPGGETHFKVLITSHAFADKSRIECHRMVNKALADELADRVHALAITTNVP